MRCAGWLRLTGACLVWLTMAVSARAYVVFPNIEYESPGSSRNQLDVYLPDNGPSPALPTVVYIHGGGWMSYSKDADVPLYVELTNRGYAVVPCNYTLSTSTAPGFPQAVQDVKNVVRWVRVHGSQYGLSPKVVVVGPSAGGHLAMMAATTSGDPMFETLEPPLGGYRPQAFVNIVGFSDLEWHATTYGQNYMFLAFLGQPYGPETQSLYRSASPIFHVTACDPPGALIHGTADPVVPHQHSLMMADMMAANDIFASVSLVEGAGHSFSHFGGFVGVAERIDTMVQLLLPHMSTPDLNGDGNLNVADFTAMLNLFGLNDTRADINGDGHLNIVDFTSYLQLFARGCGD